VVLDLFVGVIMTGMNQAHAEQRRDSYEAEVGARGDAALTLVDESHQRREQLAARTEQMERVAALADKNKAVK
jgi:hypothetical protein